MTSRADGHNVFPAADIALAILVISHSHHRAVGFQAYGVIYFYADGHNIFPVADIAPATPVTSHSHHRAVGFQTYGVICSRADGISLVNGIPDFHTALPGILIITEFVKCLDCPEVLSVCQQDFRNGIITGLDLFSAVPVAVKGGKDGDCILILALLHQGDGGVIFPVQNDGFTSLNLRGTVPVAI